MFNILYRAGIKQQVLLFVLSNGRATADLAVPVIYRL